MRRTSIGHSRSSRRAIPWPTPIHIMQRLRRALRASISLIDVVGGRDGAVRSRDRREARELLECRASLMQQNREPGTYASWIAPPSQGIDDKPGDFEYVRIAG
jgi:hypothetical protein